MGKPLSFANFKTIIADFEKTTPKMLQTIKSFFVNVTNNKINQIEPKFFLFTLIGVLLGNAML